jgi:hypothetical protein
MGEADASSRSPARLAFALPLEGTDMKILSNFAPALMAAMILAACTGGPGVRTVQISDQDHDRLMAINDNRIVPGVRIGPVFLGMTEGDLYKKLGAPIKTSYHNQGQTSYEYTTRGLFVDVGLNTHVVDLIAIQSAAYSTAGGVTIGSSPLQMKAELGPHNGTADFLHQFNYDGITLQFDTNGNISGLYVTFLQATGQSVHF